MFSPLPRSLHGDSGVLLGVPSEVVQEDLQLDLFGTFLDPLALPFHLLLEALLDALVGVPLGVLLVVPAEVVGLPTLHCPFSPVPLPLSLKTCRETLEACEVLAARPGAE